MIVFGTSNNTTTVNYVYNGNARYSHFTTPLITLHNNLAGVEGLVDGHAWHLSTAEKTVVGNTSGTNTGDQVADGTTILGAGSIADPFRVANVTGPQGPQGFQGDIGPQGF
jgi:hypothetical protein